MQRFIKILYSPLISVVMGLLICLLAAWYAVDTGLAYSLDSSVFVLGAMFGIGFCAINSGICKCLSRDPAYLR